MARCDSYPPGECTRGACDLTNWVGDWWGNAFDWLTKAQALGFETTYMPTVTSVVVYAGGHLYSPLGHVAVVISVADAQHFAVQELNYVSRFSYDTRASNMADVMGFVLPPGVKPAGSPGGAPLPIPATVGGVSLAWAEHQNLWNTHFPNAFNALGEVNAAIDALSKK